MRSGRRQIIFWNASKNDKPINECWRSRKLRAAGEIVALDCEKAVPRRITFTAVRCKARVMRLRNSAK
jgi:hypothetical protein